MKTIKTASEKYNEFIDYNGMSRTVRDGHEVAYRYDGNKELIILAWEKNGEFFHIELSQRDLSSDESVFESMVAYYAQHLNNNDVYSVGYWFDVMRMTVSVEDHVSLADIVGWDCYVGNKFEDDTEEEEITLYVRFNGSISGKRSDIEAFLDNGKYDNLTFTHSNEGYVCENEINPAEFQGAEF